MNQHRLQIQRYAMQFSIAVLAACAIAGCSTRQVSSTLEGSTAQRLVTLSLDQFIAALAEQPEIEKLSGKSIHLEVHFLADHPLLGYTTRLLNVRLQLIHGVTVMAASEPADFDVDIFFHSLGTDSDTFGLSVPTLGLVAAEDATIDILALDKFHGITEGYAIVTESASGTITETERLRERVRRDHVSTPIFNFPLNEL